MILPYFSQYKVAIIAGVAIAISAGSAFTAWHLTNEYVTAKYERQLSDLNATAIERINSLLEEKNKVENELFTIRDKVQSEYEETINRQERTIANLRAANVRLRDPGHSPDRCPGAGTSSATGSPERASSTGRVLSESATEFLFDYAGEADRTLEQLRACRAWVDQTQQALKDWNQKR